MTFLAPFALIGILLLALPILVHLFKPRKMRQTPFSSLRWLRQTQQRLSRRIQWHQWLLFLLRAACILLLVLALAKPLVGPRSAGRPTDRFVVVDISRSMAYKAGDQPAPLEKAQELGAHILENGGPGDRTALLLAGAGVRVAAPLSGDAAAHAAALRAATAGPGDADLTAALPVVRSMLTEGNAERALELVFLTDNLKSRWRPGAIQEFLKQSKPQIRVVDVGYGTASNAWIADAAVMGSQAGERLVRVLVGSAGAANGERSVRLAGIAGLADDRQPVTLKPGQLARVDFKLPGDLGLQGQVAELRLEPADSLPSDDVFYLNLDTSLITKVLLVEPEQAGPDGRSTGLYVRAGVAALSAASNQALAFVTRNDKTLTPADIQQANVIFLAGVPELAPAALEMLETRVRSGVGLVVFLGPRVSPAFYNEKLHRPLQPSEGLLPLPLKAGPNVFLEQGDPGRLSNIEWTHPLLAPLRDPVLGDLERSRFRFHCVFVGTPGKDLRVLARLDDETPVIMEHVVGAGRVLIFNTTANDEWSDLPRKQSFVPLLDRMLAYLTGGSAHRTYTVGRAITLALGERPAAEEVTVRTPGGAALAPRLQSVRGQTFLHLDNVAEAGIYRVRAGDKELASFVANAGRGDSSLSPMDAKVLRDWWAPAEVENLDAETATTEFAAAPTTPLWPALVLLAGLLLLAETIYVYRLCPRVNPKVANAVVHERGLLKPLQKDPV